MNRLRLLLPVIGVLLPLLPLSNAVASDGDNLDVRFMLYAIPKPDSVNYAGSCFDGGVDPISQNIPCSSYGTTWPLPQGQEQGPWVYVVAAQGGPAGIDGVSFGIDYTPGSGPGNGISEDYLTFAGDWVTCQDGLPFPSITPEWPHPGSGILLTWATCQNTEVGSDGVHAVVAKFYVAPYSDDTLEITPNYTRSSGAELSVHACDAGGTLPVNILDYTDPALWNLLTGKLQFGNGRPGHPGYNPCGVIATERSTWGHVKALFGEHDQHHP